jgi:hypothetical protein
MAQWRLAVMDRKPDCRECHMPRVVRKMTQATGIISKPLVAMEKPAVEHRHLFLLTPTELPFEPFSLDVDVDRGSATLSLRNLLPHNLPTGDYGVRIIEIKVLGVEAGGRAAELARHELTNFGRDPLVSGQARRWTLTLPPALRSLRIEIARQGRERPDHVLLLRKEVVLP